MNIVIDDGLRDDPFNFEDLPENEDKQEKKTMKKIINWAKQLF